MDSHAEGEHHDDHGGLGKYGVVFLCLCALTACSFMTTQTWWPFAKAPTWIFMMGVSCAKAMLVIMVFMHLMWEANWKYVLTIPAAMMSCFLVLMLIPDVGLRGNHYSEERSVYAADVVVEHGDDHGGHGEAAHGDGHSDDHAGEHGASTEHGAADGAADEAHSSTDSADSGH